MNFPLDCTPPVFSWLPDNGIFRRFSPYVLVQLHFLVIVLLMRVRRWHWTVTLRLSVVLGIFPAQGNSRRPSSGLWKPDEIPYRKFAIFDSIVSSHRKRPFKCLSLLYHLIVIILPPFLIRLSYLVAFYRH